MPVLSIKRIYDTPAAADGYRILVDRLWPRGVKKSQAAINLWMKDIAPSPTLRKWFNHDPAKWEHFQEEYKAELKDKTAAIQQILHLLNQQNVTLLYASKNPDCNHALVLKSYLLSKLSY